MRRSERELSERAALEAIIRDCQVCRLAFARGDEPYLLPISFGFDGEALYFHTAPEGRKIDFIRANDRVCFEFERKVELVSDPDTACKWTFGFESVVGYGRIAELTATDDKRLGLNWIMRQYSGKDWEYGESILARTRVWRLRIESMTGKRSEMKSS